MCGIIGFFGKGTQDNLEGMTQTLFHRGPDEVGYYKDSDVPLYFGHRRLMIRDKMGGRQPMMSHDEQIIIVFNGEIYNAAEIRSELETIGYKFQSSHSDTEVLIYAYKEWGTKFVDKLNGMWAFAIYDRSNKSLFLSRDRFGQKPLFYTLQNNTFAFASEIKAFRQHSELSLTLSAKGLQKYHAYGYVPKDNTIYKEIKKLPGGCNLIFYIDSLDIKINKYWTYKLEPEQGKKESYWIDTLQDLLRASIKRRLVSDVPLGIFLSGGLDSSAISIFTKEALQGQDLNSFSIGFSDPTFDETESANQVSQFVGTKHSSVTFSPDMLTDVQNELFSLLDEPLSDSSMLSYYLLCRHARKNMTVALGGDAGDELFAGYDTFKAMGIANWIKRLLPRACHDAIIYMLAKLPSSHSYMTTKFKLERLLKGYGLPSALWNPIWLGPVSSKEIEAITNEPVNLEELYSEAIELWDESKTTNLTDKTLEFYGNIFLQDQILVKVDRLSMMRSLEVRTPLLDIDLVNCIRKIPSSLKLKGKHAKYILKKAVETSLPDNIVWRKKIGFSAPLSRWFANGAITFEENQNLNETTNRLVNEKLKSHKSLQTEQRLFLWNNYVLSKYLENNRETLKV
jgi:asparagine synthase (glutamine-hydrolysing)